MDPRLTDDPELYGKLLEAHKFVVDKFGFRITVSMKNGKQYSGFVTSMQASNNAGKGDKWAYGGSITLVDTDAGEISVDLLDVESVALET